MKCVTPALVQLEKKELQKLCVKVKETLAIDIRFSEKKPSFGVTDLWNMRRTMKTASSLRSNRIKIQSLI
jgi:hypothetical protein